MLIGMVFLITCEMLRILKLVAFTAVSKFCKWVEVRIDVDIPHYEYQVKPHSSPWFSTGCAADVAHRSKFFHMYQQ